MFCLCFLLLVRFDHSLQLKKKSDEATKVDDELEVHGGLIATAVNEYTEQHYKYPALPLITWTKDDVKRLTTMNQASC